MLCLKKFSWICSTQHPFLCNFLQINVQKFYKWLRHSKQTARETESQDPVNTPTWGKRWSKSFIFTYAKLPVMMLLLLLSHFSRVQLCATPETAAHQASQSLGFSRQEHWSGLPFPSPMHESEKWKVKVKSLSHVRPSATPWTAAYQTSPSMGFSRQEYWSGVPSPSAVRC